MSYPGGKNGPGVYHALINLMPPHDVYIEPFLGGAAIMRLKRPASLNIGVDLDIDALKSARVPAESPIQSIAATTGETCERRRHTSTGSAIADGRDGIRDGRPSPKFELLQGDALEFLRGHQVTGGELIYCDPPYLRSTRATSRDMYRFEMTDGAHRELLSILKQLQCRVMISGYSSALYARELRGWNATSFATVTRGGTSVAEWVWYNFPRPTALHDYRFLGENFRERERLKRRKATWLKKLHRMPILERQAVLSAIANLAELSA